MKQMTTLVGLMRQQMEWSMRNEDAKRDHGIGAAEALETRMREMEVWYHGIVLILLIGALFKYF